MLFALALASFSFMYAVNTPEHSLTPPHASESVVLPVLSESIKPTPSSESVCPAKKTFLEKCSLGLKGTGAHALTVACGAAGAGFAYWSWWLFSERRKIDAGATLGVAVSLFYAAYDALQYGNQQFKSLIKNEPS